MNNCKCCEYCYPMKQDERLKNPRQYVCVYESEAYTNSPFMSPVIADPYVFSCKYFQEKTSKGENTHGRTK